MQPEHWLYTIPLRLRSLFRRKQVDQELDDEFRDHVERKTDEYVAKGMSPQEARRQSFLEMGGIEQRKEECRDTRRVNWLQDLLQDFRFGLRMLRKSPGFAAVAILTLALGIGANTAIFTLVNAVMLQSLPVRNPSELYRLGNDNFKCCVMSGLQGRYTLFSKALYDQLRNTTPEFSELTAFQARADAISLRRNGVQGDSRVGHAEYVSGNYFQTARACDPYCVGARMHRIVT